MSNNTTSFLNRLLRRAQPRRAITLRADAPAPRAPECAASNYARMERDQMARDRRMVDYR